MSFFPTDRVSVVAEISCNHGGKLDNALRLIEAAKECGADLVKFQAYLADELTALRGDGPAPAPWDHLTMRALYEEAATPLDWFPYLAEYCLVEGIPWFASVFGSESLAAMEACGCPAYKIAAMEWGNEGLHEMVEATGKPLVASCPAPHAPAREPVAVRGWRAGMRAAELMAWYTTPQLSNAPRLCFCPPGYAQPAAHIRNIATGYWGYSYHGTDPDIPAYAVAAGAQYIETHLMLEAEPSKFEAGFAFTEKGFAEMVKRVRKAEAAL